MHTPSLVSLQSEHIFCLLLNTSTDHRRLGQSKYFFKLDLYTYLRQSSTRSSRPHEGRGFYSLLLLVFHRIYSFDWWGEKVVGTGHPIIAYMRHSRFHESLNGGV